MNLTNTGILGAIVDVAAQEAANAGFSEITPAHLLMTL
jgi:hypothetical protein